MPRSLLLLAVSCLALPGAAAPKSALEEVVAPPGRFPSRTEIEAIAASSPPLASRSNQEIGVGSWQATGPFPGGWSPRTPEDKDDPFLAIARKVAKKRRNAMVSEAAVCTAREIGRFFLATTGVPQPELKGWLSRRCALSQEPRLLWQAVQADDEATDEALVAALTQGLEEGFGKIALDGDELGIWQGREAGVAVVMMVAAPRKAIFDKLPNTPSDDDTVTVAGTLRLSADSVFALVNRGADGYARCEVDAKVKLPKFCFTCRVSPDDGAVMIELGAQRPGRVIGERLGWLLARRPGRMPMQWTAPAAEASELEPQALRQKVLTLVNDRRIAAGLRPLREVVAQSQVVASLAPAFFAAGTGSSAPGERAMLGVLAGYEIDARLQDAWISAASASAASAQALVDALFEQPGARRTLMEPAASLVALGLLSDQNGASLLVATYDVLEPGEEQSLTDEAVSRWMKARRDAGRPSLTRLQEADAALRAVAEQIAAGALVGEVLPAGLEEAAKAAGRPVRGGAVLAESLLDLEAPAPLARAGAGSFAVGSAWVKTDSPWGRYVVVFAVTE